MIPPHRPELVKRRPPNNRRLVHPLSAVNIVITPVTVDCAETGGPAAGVVGTVALDDVVLDERVLCPAVEGEVRVHVAAGPGAVVLDHFGPAGVPAFAADPVAYVGPGGGVSTVGLVAVVDGAAAVGPVGVEVTAVEAVAFGVASGGAAVGRVELGAEVEGAAEELFV